MTLKDYQKIVYDTARECGLPDMQAKIIVGQATHESGRFTSPLFIDDNNAFGMHIPNVRGKTYIDGGSKKHLNPPSEGKPTYYAHYNSLKRSIQDMILGWHKYNKTDWNKMTTPTAYANYLKQKSYYQGPLDVYIKRIAEYVKSLSWVKPVAIGSGIIVVVALITILLTFKS